VVGVEGEFVVTVGQRITVHSYLAPWAGRYASSHLLELPDRLVLVDLPLLAAHTAEVLARVADLAKPLAEVFVTEDGADHVAGTALLELPVTATAGIRQRVARHGRDAVEAAYREARIGQPVTGRGPHVDRAARPGPALIGDVAVVLHRFGPASAPEHLVLELPDDGLLVTGDLVGNGVHPRLDRRRPARWTAALRWLRGRSPAVVLPGHGRPGGPELIDGMLRYLEVAQFVLAGADDDAAEAALRRAFPEHRTL
jgi:glyoxylase-like metal-dependent hydrolase (beta-lactamase superfamily II)